MTDSRKDAIAREAARLVEAGRAGNISEAIKRAAEALGLQHAAMPGAGRVRRHVQAMSMQALGDAGYAESVRSVWRIAERLMTVLVEAIPDAEPLLMGRAAQGLIDGGVTLHVRLYTETEIGDIAHTLVEFGYEEPAFETADTRIGRLNRLRFTDDGTEIVLTRCLPHMADTTRLDLFTGKPIRSATLADLRGRIG